jgi:hypothetical protein
MRHIENQKSTSPTIQYPKYLKIEQYVCILKIFFEKKLVNNSAYQTLRFLEHSQAWKYQKFYSNAT